MNAAIFTRVSTPGQKDNQAAELQRFCATQRWKVTRSYALISSSGSREWHRRMDQLFQDASKREFDVLVFWSLDRLSREGALNCLHTMQALSAYGIKYRSLQEPYLDTTQPFGEVIVAFVATMAKMERERIRARTVAGIERARRAGTKIGRARLVIDASRLATARDRDRQSVRAIAKRFKISTATVVRRLREWDQWEREEKATRKQKGRRTK